MVFGYRNSVSCVKIVAIGLNHCHYLKIKYFWLFDMSRKFTLVSDRRACANLVNSPDYVYMNGDTLGRDNDIFACLCYVILRSPSQSLKLIIYY